MEFKQCRNCEYWISFQDIFDDPEEEWEDGYCRKAERPINAFEDSCDVYKEVK